MVKNIRVQKKIYCIENLNITKSEYIRLVIAASSNRRLSCIMQTICSTGIRISELKHFTIENVRQGEVTVICKNKVRTILIPTPLKEKLLEYAREGGIENGMIFVTRNEMPIGRSNI